MTTPLAPRKLRVLLFSTLYPSDERPGHGIFVETRLRELLKLGGVEARVMAPVPWFPSTSPRFGEYAKIARTPRRTCRNGVEVEHPRYPLIPKLGMSLAPLMMALACLGPIRRLLRQGYEFDLIDAHYVFPDGVAACLLGSWLGKPVTLTARGSDINLIATYNLPRRMIQWSLRRAAAVIGVSEALSCRLRELGALSDRVHTFRNGVDLDRFEMLAKPRARTDLGLPMRGPVLISVGHLVRNKGHDLAIECLAEVRKRYGDAVLCIVGEGPERRLLQAVTHQLGLERAVRFAGAVPQTELHRWYSAADVAVLASSREGWPNVVLEAMACGTPMVCTSVGGTPEIVTDPVAGCLVAERSASALAAGVMRMLEQSSGGESVRSHARRFDWGAISRAQVSLFERILQGTRAIGHA